MKMKPNIKKMPTTKWVMSIDSKEYRYKKRLEKWHNNLIDWLEKKLAETDKALETAKDEARIGWNWQRALLRELLDVKER